MGRGRYGVKMVGLSMGCIFRLRRDGKVSAVLFRCVTHDPSVRGDQTNVTKATRVHTNHNIIIIITLVDLTVFYRKCGLLVL